MFNSKQYCFAYVFYLCSAVMNTANVTQIGVLVDVEARLTSVQD
jgi:hypothetical protein